MTTTKTYRGHDGVERSSADHRAFLYQELGEASLPDGPRYDEGLVRRLQADLRSFYEEEAAATAASGVTLTLHFPDEGDAAALREFRAAGPDAALAILQAKRLAPTHLHRRVLRAILAAHEPRKATTR